MIIDKIKFKPGYAKDDSKTFASAGVEAEGLAPERIWRNMTNISNWNRYYPSITDIDFDNPSDTDPHIYDKAQFHFDLADGNKARCQVICFTHPKDDRVGRIAVQGTVFDPDGKQRDGARTYGRCPGRREAQTTYGSGRRKLQGGDRERPEQYYRRQAP